MGEQHVVNKFVLQAVKLYRSNFQNFVNVYLD